MSSGIRSGGTVGEVPHEPVEAAHAEERHRDDEKPRHGASAQRDAERVVQRRPGRGGRPDVRPDRDPHPDVAGEDRAARSEDEGERGPEGQPEGGRHRVEALVRPDEPVEEEDQDGQQYRQHRDRAVLAPEKGLRPLLDGVGDLLHGRGARVFLQDPPRQPPGDEERADGEDQDEGQGIVVRHRDSSPFRCESDARRISDNLWILDLVICDQESQDSRRRSKIHKSEIKTVLTGWGRSRARSRGSSRRSCGRCPSP